MSKRRLPPKVRQKARDAYAAMQKLPDYDPSNPIYSQANADALMAKLTKDQTTEVQADAAAAAARDNATDTEWEFHDFMLNVNVQTGAQYGKDSNEIQSLGLKKKSEYKKKRSKKPPTP